MLAMRDAHNARIAREAEEALAAFFCGLQFLSFKPFLRDTRYDWNEAVLHLRACRFKHQYEWIGD